ncbi:diacylglycerol kinase [Photobacterium halotolerans]|uniref:Diacylglycerol kinase n=1 Tax=Photobacterium halotolerans TaxID=265726 RepID=A0A7X4WB08_9GAMM|nr:diacylglycerol kinase [Photobacterium halotolerans]NAW64560.1 diacylglycerol kinase [Photobacterium halotolerans]NAX45901.1 diacylglycerol kinase [Photobacterium halotolerans]
MKPGNTGLVRIVKAAGYSLQGLKAAWQHEAAIRQEIILLVVLTTISFFLPVNFIEHILLVASLFLVVIVELLNSAIEAVVDRIGSEFHELSGRAKDIGSAAVFISLLLAGGIWLAIILKLFW